MYRHWLGRIGLVLSLVTGLMVAGAVASNADPEGVELVDAVAAETSGDDAFAAVVAVDAFEPDGGEAVFEPGTDSEERFTYKTVDANTKRLVGLTRPTPLSHPVGALVAPVTSVNEPPAQEPPSSEDGGATDPSATVPDAEPNEDPDASTGVPESTAASLDPAADRDVTAAGETSSSTPSPCEILLSRTCEEVIAEVCAEGVVCDILQDPLALCAEGVVCDILHDPLALCAEGTLCDILNDPPIPPECVGETCQLLEDPLGPWSVCDIENTDAECPDPDDVVDLGWEAADPPIGSLDCTASVTGPAISESGGLVRGKGAFNCNEIAVGYIKITVCLHRASGGVWLKMGCRHKKEPNEEGELFAPGGIEKKIAEPCLKQQTAKYRIRARGAAFDSFEEGEETDTAKATAILYCPGTAVEAATQDLTEYLESWLD